MKKLETVLSFAPISMKGSWRINADEATFECSCGFVVSTIDWVAPDKFRSIAEAHRLQHKLIDKLNEKPDSSFEHGPWLVLPTQQRVFKVKLGP